MFNVLRKQPSSRRAQTLYEIENLFCNMGNTDVIVILIEKESFAFICKHKIKMFSVLYTICCDVSLFCTLRDDRFIFLSNSQNLVDNHKKAQNHSSEEQYHPNLGSWTRC